MGTQKGAHIYRWGAIKNFKIAFEIWNGFQDPIWEPEWVPSWVPML